MAKPSLKKFQEACETSAGILTHVAGVFGVTRATVYNWVNSDAEFKKSINDARETFGDLIEHKLLEHVNKGDKTILIFLAKTLLKNRGYVERLETIDKTVPFGKDDIDSVSTYGAAHSKTDESRL